MNKAMRVSYQAAILCGVLGGTVFGQWVEQTVELEPGWTSVFLEIDPVPAPADDLFADRPEIEAIWKRGDPTLVAGRQADSARWQTWVPPGDPARFAINLRVIDGGAVYLIKSSAATSVTFVGRPAAEKTKYIQGFNVVGFHVDPDAPPSFEAYLAPSLAHDDTRIFKLKDTPPLDGSLLEVTDLSGPVQPAVGFWVKANGTAEYDGPLSIDKGTLRGINFAKSLLDHSVTLENLAAAPAGVDVRVEYIDSAAPPADTPDNPGAAPIHWRSYGSGLIAPDNPMFIQNDLAAGDPPALWHLEPRGSESARRSVRLSVRRQGLAGASLDPEGQGAQYQGLLKISDGAGFRRLLPVTAQVMGLPAGLRGVPPPGPPGLWAGLVVIREVQWVTAGARIWTNDDPNSPSFEQNRRCFDGWRDGQTCAADDDCVCPECTDGVCDVNLCVGGPNDGELCDSHGDCACPCDPGEDDGTCEYYCVGGPNQSQACDASDQCLGTCVHGTCSVDVCVGGPDPGGPCDDNDDCACPGLCSAEATADADVEALRPTNSQFQFPILVHIGNNGVSHMLTDVTLLWKPGIPYDDGGTPEDPSDDTPEVPGNYVLATPACPGTCCDDLEASSIVSGEPFARRMSTMVFGFDGDLELVQGQNAGLETTLDGVTVMPADHRLNPFRHKYHPDHDDPEESFEITREFGLAFYQDQPDWLPGSGWGDQLLAGDYTERVIGIYKTDFDSDPNNGPDGVTVRGQFQLRRLANVGVLNNGWIVEGDCGE